MNLFMLLIPNEYILDRYTCIPGILANFLNLNLKLELHPQKIVFRKLTWGIDFLGYIVLPHYILPRTKTKKRMVRKMAGKIEDYQRGQISKYSFNQTIQSYLGYLEHADSFEFKNKLMAML